MKATGERCDRCLWQKKGAERVAAVDKIGEKRKMQRFYRTPRQGLSEEWGLVL